jgi:hypothetical protein
MSETTYSKIAELFANRINEVFTSEDTLKAEFEKHFPAFAFSRTDYWLSIMYLMMRDCFHACMDIKAEPSGYDRYQVLQELHPLLDYNLFTQVQLNLQSYAGMAYRTGDADKHLDVLRSKWKDAKLDPFAPKAKMFKIIANETEKEFNHTLSTMRALKIVAGYTPLISFRVSPKGSTPAFADSNNISMLGVGGDQYLQTNMNVFYIGWEQPPRMIELTSDGGFAAEGIPYKFYSKSGGEVLNECLFARRIMYEVFNKIPSSLTRIMIPRMNSVMIVTDMESDNFREGYIDLWKKLPFTNIWEGTRESEPLQHG